jgi:hypothetical protein
MGGKENKRRVVGWGVERLLFSWVREVGGYGWERKQKTGDWGEVVVMGGKENKSRAGRFTRFLSAI